MRIVAGWVYIDERCALGGEAGQLRSFLCPILALTGLGTFLGLLAGSPASGDHMQAATLLGSFVSFVALLITKVRGSKEIGR